MCDVFAAIGVKDGRLLREFMKAGAHQISIGNLDGLGYTAIKKDKEIFGERWFKNDDAFKGKPVTDSDIKMAEVYGKLLQDPPDLDTYTEFGKQNWENVCSVIYHARKSTNHKSLANVHPFNSVDGKTSLIHNGVISNHEKFEKINSTCDSEGILTQYLKHNIGVKRKNIKKLFNDLEGAFTVMLTTIDGNNNRVIDVFKDDGRKLFFTTIDQLGGAPIFSSSELVIKRACEKMNWVHKNKITRVKEYSYARFNAINGKLIEIKEFEPRRSAQQSRNFNYSGSENSYEDYTCAYNNRKNNNSFSKTKKESDNRSNSQGNKKEAGASGSQNGNEKKGRSGRSNGQAPSYPVGFVDRANANLVTQFYGASKDNTSTDASDDASQNVSKETERVSKFDFSKNPNTNLTNDSKDVLDTDYKIINTEQDDGELTPLLDYTVEEPPAFKDFLLDNLEASDSKYGAVFAEMTDEELDELDEYEKEITKDEREAIAELTDDIKYHYLQQHKLEASKSRG